MRDEYNIVQSAARDSVVRHPMLFEVATVGPVVAEHRTFVVGDTFEDAAEVVGRSGRAGAFILVFVRDLT